MHRGNGELYEFGNFRLDVSEHRFSCIDGTVPGAIPEKSFQTLLYLVQNAGRLVNKQELLSAVWPDAIVEENNLDKAVHSIRVALGERSGEQKYIETVRKHGYRFVAEVRLVDTFDPQEHPSTPRSIANESGLSGTLSESGAHAIIGLEEWNRIDALVSPREETISPLAGEPAMAEPSASPERSPKVSSRRIFVSAAAVVVAAVTLGMFLFFSNREAEPSSKKYSILVLPVRPMSKSANDDLLEIGLADSLIRTLGANRHLIVRPLGSTRLYVDGLKEPLTAGEEQQADYVLDASYQTVEGRTRVTGRLIDQKTGQSAENFKVESAEQDLFALQDIVALEMARQVFQVLSLEAAPSPNKRGTGSEKAYRLYLEARYLYGKRNLKAAERAVQLLEQAVLIDPGYAAAWAAKAHAHRYAGNLGRDTDTHAEYQRSMEAANTALLIDKNISEAYSAICENKLYYEFDFEKAEQACRRAIELDPNSSFAHEIYGRFLYHRGRFDEGLREIEAAIDIDPSSLFNQRNLGIALYYSGRYEEAEDQFRRVIAIDKEFASAYMWLRNTYEIEGKFPEAFDCLINAQKIAKVDERVIQRYKRAYSAGGYMSALREHALDHTFYNQYYVSAILHTQIGEFDKAFEYLEIAFQRREWGMNSLLIEPHLKPLSSDPRFADLVRRIGLEKN